MAKFNLTDSFLKSACQLQKEQANKLFKALLLFYQNTNHPSLNYEKLTGKAAAMSSIRVDQAYRAILEGKQDWRTFHYVGTHDEAYRFAERVTPTISAQTGAPRPA